MQHKRVGKKWTVAEDEKLRRLVKEIGTKNWTEIASHLPGRMGKQCRERWRNQLDPCILHTKFTADEDNQIVSFVAEHGTKWARLSEIMAGRTENALKNRFYSSLQKQLGGGSGDTVVPRKRHRRVDSDNDDDSDDEDNNNNDMESEMMHANEDDDEDDMVESDSTESDAHRHTTKTCIVTNTAHPTPGITTSTSFSTTTPPVLITTTPTLTKHRKHVITGSNKRPRLITFIRPTTACPSEHEGASPVVTPTASRRHFKKPPPSKRPTRKIMPAWLSASPDHSHDHEAADDMSHMTMDSSNVAVVCESPAVVGAAGSVSRPGREELQAAWIGPSAVSAAAASKQRSMRISSFLGGAVATTPISAGSAQQQSTASDSLLLSQTMLLFAPSSSHVRSTSDVQSNQWITLVRQNLPEAISTLDEEWRNMMKQEQTKHGWVTPPPSLDNTPAPTLATTTTPVNTTKLQLPRAPELEMNLMLVRPMTEGTASTISNDSDVAKMEAAEAMASLKHNSSSNNNNDDDEVGQAQEDIDNVNIVLSEHNAANKRNSFGEKMLSKEVKKRLVFDVPHLPFKKITSPPSPVCKSSPSLLCSVSCGSDFSVCESDIPVDRTHAHVQWSEFLDPARIV